MSMNLFMFTWQKAVARLEVRSRAEAGYDPLSDKDAKSAEDFIRAYYKNIVEKWMNFFVLKKKVRCTQITKKVK